MTNGAAKTRRPLDLTGQQFGSLTVLRRGQRKAAVGRHVYWLCRCACGKETEVRAGGLRGGQKTCGCVVRRTHGMTGTKLHCVWHRMKSRCQRPRDVSYANYGGRGIRVCARWQKFENFYADMWPSYRPGLTIDRVNNDGNYEPSNCRWATHSEQMKNRRKWTWGGYRRDDYLFGAA